MREHIDSSHGYEAVEGNGQKHIDGYCAWAGASNIILYLPVLSYIIMYYQTLFNIILYYPILSNIFLQYKNHN